MKKFLSVAFILVAMILVGCGGKTADKYAPESEKVDAILLADSFWVVDAENMPYLTDAITRKDTEYLNQLMLEGKVFRVDKDTKVTRFGVAANENNVLIQFKEGRYTNKAGCTFKQYVYTEEDYLVEKHKEEERLKKEFQTKMEQEKQEVIALIQDCFGRTEKYFLIISTGNEEELKSLAELCSRDERRLIEAEAKSYSDMELYKMLNKARDVVTSRGVSILNYLNFKIKDGETEKYHQKAEQFRQEFKNKYGY